MKKNTHRPYHQAVLLPESSNGENHPVSCTPRAGLGDLMDGLLVM